MPRTIMLSDYFYKRLFSSLHAALLSAVLIGVPAPRFLIAQGLTGQISGRVQDPTDKLVAGAGVSLTNPATGLRRATKTNGDGEFVFPEVLPGRFELLVESPGFKKFEEKEIFVSASEHLVLSPVSLTLGQFNETVSVTTTPAPIDTESSAPPEFCRALPAGYWERNRTAEAPPPWCWAACCIS